MTRRTAPSSTATRGSARHPGSCEIEGAIDRELRVRLPVGNQARASAPTGSPEAFHLYLKGRYYWNTRTEENLRRSAEAFQQAIDNDPGYSLAWAGLADAFLMLGAWSVLEPKDAYPRAKAAADRAIALDSSLAEPYATIGYLKTLYERDWSGADAAFRRAIDLHPDYATAHHWYAFYLQTIGDIAGSLARIERASEIDPLSPVINSERSYFYSYARQYERALQEARTFVSIAPASAYARVMLAQAYAQLRRGREAAREARRDHGGAEARSRHRRSCRLGLRGDRGRDQGKGSAPRSARRLAPPIRVSRGDRGGVCRARRPRVGLRAARTIHRGSLARRIVAAGPRAGPHQVGPKVHGAVHPLGVETLTPARCYNPPVALFLAGRQEVPVSLAAGTRLGP